jgi:hypothetical protein
MVLEGRVHPPPNDYTNQPTRPFLGGLGKKKKKWSDLVEQIQGCKKRW